MKLVIGRFGVLDRRGNRGKKKGGKVGDGETY